MTDPRVAPQSMARRSPAAAAAKAVSSLIVVGGLGIFYAAYAVLAPLPAVPATVKPPPSITTPAATVSLPVYGATAIGAADHHQIYAGTELDTPRPIASITKVITALVVLEQHPISGQTAGATLTLTVADTALQDRYSAINGTTAPAPAGLVISQRQVIELMMVQSANNYAETLAVWAFGSVDSYLIAARDWLDRHNLSAITVTDTTGFSPENVASPRALLELGRIALDDPVVSQASALPSVSVPGIGMFTNRNRIIGVDGVTGLKTGTLDEAGACLLFTAEHEVRGEIVRVVGVVLGAPDHARLAADVRVLLASIRDDYHTVNVATEGTIVAVYEAPWGESARLEVDETVRSLVWGPVASRAGLAPPPMQPGVETGSPPPMLLRVGGSTVRVSLRLHGEISGPDLGWRLGRPIVELLGG